MSESNRLDKVLPAQDVSSSDVGAWFDVGDLRDGYIFGVDLTDLTGGTTPSVDCELEFSFDKTNVWETDSTLAAFTSVTRGLVRGTNMGLPFARFKWTTTGAPTSAAATFYLKG